MITQRTFSIAAMTAFALSIIFGGFVFGHHSQAGFETPDKAISMKGTVVEFRWRNPHILVFWDVKDDGTGKVVRWVGELGSTATASASGLTKDSLKQGDEIAVTAIPSRAGTPQAVISKLVKGFEFLQLPDRAIQFFEWGHNWRTIWTDGRKLPENPPEPRWLGYAVGHWEGDTFIVESNGYDDRTWLTEDRRDRRWGFPHSDQLRVEEKYRRISYDTLEATLTIIDPKVFKKPWTTTGKITMSVGTELGEYLCVPSDNDLFNQQYVFPAAGGKQ